jgi:hypothetical protein
MADAAAPLAYLWQVPGKRISVSLGLDVVDRVSLAVLEGFQALPRRGLEIGGFLLGRTKRNGESTCVEVDDFEPLACEHAVGPSYLLSALDRKLLEERIRWHKSKGGPSIVGFYRSHTRKEFTATLEDVDVLTNYFSDPSHVFLLMHAHREAPPAAGFVIWEGRKIRSLRPYLEFPLRRAALMAGGYEIVSGTLAKPAVPEKPAKEPRSPAVAETPRARPAATRVPWRPRLPAVLRTPLRRPKLPRWTAKIPRRLKMPQALSQFARQQRARLNIDWTMAASVLAIVVFAILLHREYTTPVSAPPGMEAAREHKFAAAPASQMAMRSALAIPTNGPAPEPATMAPPAPAAAPPMSAPPAKPYRENGERARVASTIPPIAALPPAVAPADSAAPETLPDPPDVSAGPAMPSELLARSSDILQPEIPRIANPLVSVAVESVPEPHGGGLLHKLGLSGKRGTPAGFVPPKPVREPATEVPPNLRQGMIRQIPVDVKVYVDRDGKVKYAELLSKATGATRDLASLAVFSSRRWEFSPARLGDETVPAEVILRFRFGPESR